MRIAMVAGEASGDALGAGLMAALQQYYPNAVFEGVGGPAMVALGFQTFTPMERLSVMGFVEPLGRLPELLRLKRTLVTHLIQNPPDVFIGIDSPGFNLRLEKELHDAGIKTVHYVSPTVWAWGEKRIHKIALAVDKVLALFPFETRIYEEHDIDVSFVGHPLADRIEPTQDQQQIMRSAREQLALASDIPVLTLMPGSRGNEVERLGRVFIRTAKRCLKRQPQMRFVVPCANAQRREQLAQMLEQEQCSEQFILLEGESHLAMQAADLVLLASGTATLEAALLRRPMIVCYRFSPLTWLLARRLVKVPYIALPNLLAGRKLVPAFLQHAVTAPALTEQVFDLLENTEARVDMYSEFDRIHQQLRCNADQQAAAAVREVISS